MGRKVIFVATAGLITLGSIGSACSFESSYMTVYGHIACWRFLLGARCVHFCLCAMFCPAVCLLCPYLSACLVMFSSLCVACVSCSSICLLCPSICVCRVHLSTASPSTSCLAACLFFCISVHLYICYCLYVCTCV